MIQQLNHPSIQDSLSVDVLRLDLINLPIGGNKWYKLKYNLIEAQSAGMKILVTFGGAFSNHLYAFAKACREYQLKGVAFIRADGFDPENPTMTFLQGMNISMHFISRSEYRKKEKSSDYLDLAEEIGKHWLIPEGGSNAAGFKGVSEIGQFISSDYDRIIVSAGTGCTAAGIIDSCNTLVEVYSVLKGYDHTSDIRKWLSQDKNFKLVSHFHFGGYAKTDRLLIEFINDFKLKTGIPLDPVYTGKAMYGLMERIEGGKYPQGSKLLFIHTGGLQGIIGHNYLNPAIAIS